MKHSDAVPPRPPTHDDALIRELGISVVIAIMRENEPDEKRRGHTVRNKARKAIGKPGPVSAPKVKTPSLPPKRRRRGGLVYTATGRLEPQAAPHEVVFVPTAPSPQRVPGERVCHACLQADVRERERFAKELAERKNHIGASRETAAAERLRTLISVAPHRDCAFHRPKPRTRRETPEPTVRPPGIAEMSR